MRCPVRARVARPVSRSSSSVTPRRRRWSTRVVHPAGAYPAVMCGWSPQLGRARSVEVVPAHGRCRRWRRRSSMAMVLSSHEPGRVGDGVVPGGGAGDHALDLGVGGLQHAHGRPVQRGEGEGGRVGGLVEVARGVEARATSSGSCGSGASTSTGRRAAHSSWVGAHPGGQRSSSQNGLGSSSRAPTSVGSGVVVEGGWGVGQHGQAPHQGLARVEVDARVEDGRPWR